MDPTQQRTCLWPSWLRNDVKRSGNSFRSLVRSTVSSTTPVASIRRASYRGRCGAMTPKIAQFLAEQQPVTPCLVLDVDRVEANFRALARALPLARIYYAVKANPAAPVLERLVHLSSGFDAASFEEIEACLGPARRLKRSASATRSRRSPRSAARTPPACRCSLSIPTEELQKIAEHAPGRRCTAVSGRQRRRRLAAVAQVRHHRRDGA